MRTAEHLTIHRRKNGRFPSNLTDAEWEHLAPLIPPASPGGRPRKTDMRSAMQRHFLPALRRLPVALPAVG